MFHPSGLWPGELRAELSKSDAGYRAHRAEGRLRREERKAAEARRADAGLGKKAVPPANRDVIIDRDIFAEIVGALREGLPVRLTDRSGGSVTRVQTYLTDYRREQNRAADRTIARRNRSSSHPEIRSVWVPAWKHTGDFLKLFAWSHEVFEGVHHAMSVRLSDDVVKSALQEVRKLNGKTFTRHIADRVQRQLRAAFPELPLEEFDYVIAIEATAWHEVHLHGVVAIPDEEDVPDAYQRVKAALDKAGGSWRVGGRSTARQTHLSELTTPTRWLAYATKWAAQTQQFIGCSPFAAPNGLRARAKTAYDQLRSQRDVIDPRYSVGSEQEAALKKRITARAVAAREKLVALRSAAL